MMMMLSTVLAVLLTVPCGIGSVVYGEEACVTLLDTKNGDVCQCTRPPPELPPFPMQVCGTDECASNPCMNGGNCSDFVNFYKCTCLPGYEGINCEYEKTNECASNPCMNGGSCSDFVNFYKCICLPEYEGINCEKAPPQLNTTEITLSCMATEMIIDIPKALLTPEMRGRDVVFENANETSEICMGEDVGGGDGIIRLTTSLTGCGTLRTESNSTDIYTNRVVNHYSDGDVVSHTYIIDIPLTCTYNRSQRIQQGVRYRLTDYTIYRDLQETGAYDISFKIFEDNSYTSPVAEYPYMIDLNEMVYFAAELNSLNDGLDLDLSIQSCRATPTDNYEHTIRYDFIDQGCPISNKDDTKLNYLNNHRIGMETKAFRFINGQGANDMVYIHCVVTVCEEGGPPCSDDCASPTSARQPSHPDRRRRSGVSGPGLRGGLAKTKRFTRGPLRVTRPTDDDSDYGMVAIATGVMVVAIMAVAFRKVYRMKNSTKKEYRTEEDDHLLSDEEN